MEAIQYVEINAYGSAVVAGTGIHVTAVGFAYEGGYPEQEVLDWFHLTQEQLHGVLAYFYRHRDELVAAENKAAEQAQAMAQKGTAKLRAWREKKST